MVQKVSDLTFVPTQTCHLCARPLTAYSNSDGSPGVGSCEKHGISYDRSFADSKKHEVEIDTCPKCEETAIVDEDGDKFCTECKFDEYTNSDRS